MKYKTFGCFDIYYLRPGLCYYFILRKLRSKKANYYKENSEVSPIP